jgi:hypothetical protein
LSTTVTGIEFIPALKKAIADAPEDGVQLTGFDSGPYILKLLVSDERRWARE